MHCRQKYLWVPWALKNIIKVKEIIAWKGNSRVAQTLHNFKYEASSGRAVTQGSWKINEVFVNLRFFSVFLCWGLVGVFLWVLFFSKKRRLHPSSLLYNPEVIRELLWSIKVLYWDDRKVVNNHILGKIFELCLKKWVVRTNQPERWMCARVLSPEIEAGSCTP